jgi:hypothetical protein
MIIEDERGLDLKFFFDNVGSRVQPQRNLDGIETFLRMYRQIEDANAHT